MSDASHTLTVEETAQLLGISRGSAYAACAAGELPTLKLGRRILVPRARLLTLLGETPELSPNANRTATNGPVGKEPEDARHDPS